MGYEWLALAAACLWAIASLLSITPAKHLGSFAYSRWRMGCTSVILTTIALFSGGWSTVHSSAIPAMMLSGFIGIFIGDTALFACLNRMGPRQSGLLFSCHAVFSAVLGYFLFSESMTKQELFGSTLVFSGVLMAIFFGRRGQTGPSLDSINGSVWVGIGLGLTAALCQALGGIIAKPVIANRDRSDCCLCDADDHRLCGSLFTAFNRRTHCSSYTNHHAQYLFGHGTQRLYCHGGWYDADPLRSA